MTSKLFVGNLSFNTTDTELHDAFSAHGAVQEVKIVLDRDTGRPRGFAFVTMSTPEDAQKAIAALNGTTLGDRALAVSEARPREERPGGTFPGGSRGGGARGGGGREGREQNSGRGSFDRRKAGF